MGHKIQMVDLHGQYLRYQTEIDAAMAQVIADAAFIQGPHVQAFAASLANYTGAGMIIPCANGTDALQIAMMGLGLKPGDEVILPSHTYVATAEVIALLGLVPVLVDVNEETFNINLSEFEKHITKKTKAVVPVHLYGQCADMESILEIAARHNLFVIEDNAQALGAEYIFKNGTRKKAGAMGTVGTTSFFPTKTLGCFGDGGAMLTNDKSLGETLRMVASHGQKIRYVHDIIGVNSRLDTLQAAILDVKLKHLDADIQKRNAVAAFYDEALAGIEGIHLPVRSGFSTHAFYQYTLRADRRDALKQHLEQHSVPSMIYYPSPIHLQRAYKDVGRKGDLVVTERLMQTIISPPMHTELTMDELEYICDTIKKFYR